MATVTVTEVRLGVYPSADPKTELLYRAAGSVFFSYPSWEAVKNFMDGDDSSLVEELKAWPVADSFVRTNVGGQPCLWVESATQGREFVLDWSCRFEGDTPFLRGALKFPGGSIQAAYGILRHFLEHGGDEEDLFVQSTDNKGKHTNSGTQIPKLMATLAAAVAARREKEEMPFRNSLAT